jgi:hypothetical protein
MLLLAAAAVIAAALLAYMVRLVHRIDNVARTASAVSQKLTLLSSDVNHLSYRQAFQKSLERIAPGRAAAGRGEAELEREMFWE